MGRMTRQRLHFLTRQPRFILRVFVATLAAGMLMAWVVGKMNPVNSAAQVEMDLNDITGEDRESVRPESVSDLREEAFAALLPKPLTEEALVTWLGELRKREFPLHALSEAPMLSLKELSDLSDWWEDLTTMECRDLALRALAAAKLPADRELVFQQFINATWLEGPLRMQAQEALQAVAQQEPLVPLANVLLGEMWLNFHGAEAALAAFTREGARPEAAWARQQALSLCVQHRLERPLRDLLQQPLYEAERAALSLSERSQTALVLGEYGELLRVHLEVSWQSVRAYPTETCAALLCGIIWFVMLHQLGGMRMRGAWLSGLAVGLGLLSPTITLFIMALQEHVGGLAQNGQLNNDLLYFVAGVGLREECSKLLLFAPLLWLLRGKSEAVILVTAGCVGLGFAVEENVNYFVHGLGDAPLARLVSANFMHVALTALAGLALARWVRYPKSCWESGLATIVTMIVLHGLYDFTIEARTPMAAFSLGSFPAIILLGLAHYFLTQLKQVRLAQGNIVAPLFAFLLGLAVLCSFALIAATLESGFRQALLSLVASGLGSVFLIFMFCHHLHRE